MYRIKKDIFIYCVSMEVNMVSKCRFDRIMVWGVRDFFERRKKKKKRAFFWFGQCKRNYINR